eukprot:Skav204515  [mRNA]  locus=scaffold3201:99100:106360:+ [translate_table: standard]
MSRPLAIGSASGAISSLILSAARAWLEDPGIPISESIGHLGHCLPCPEFNWQLLEDYPWGFFFTGLLVGIFLGPVVDLLWLAKEKWRRWILRQFQSLATESSIQRPPAYKIICLAVSDVEAVRRLTLRVDRLQDTVDSWAGAFIGPGPGPGLGRAISGSSSEGGYQAPPTSVGSFSVVGDSAAAATSTEIPSWDFREEVAREIGAFFVRALSGSFRGSSGRQRLPQLKSRIYIVARDWEGREYRRPVKITTRFAEVKSLCSRSGDFADSVFCGVPSIREAKVVGGNEAEEFTPSQAGASTPRNFLVVQGDQAVLDYSVGRLFISENLESSSIVAVAVINEQLLVAVPQSVWHRTTAKRKLPAQTLSKPVLVSLGACSAVDQLAVISGSYTVKVWCGFVSAEIETELEFPEGGDPTYGFGEYDGAPILPYGESLLEVAREHFGFVSAESGNNQGEDPKTTQRLEHLEQALGSIQKSLDVLLQQKVGGKDAAAPKSAAPKKPAAAAQKMVPGDKGGDKFGGLDEGVVAAALKAGVPAAHLREMGKIMQLKPKRLEDVPRKTTILSDCEAEDEEEVVGDGEASDQEEGASGDSGVAQAIVQLTRICSKLAEPKNKKSDGLESLLDGLGSGSNGETSTLPGNRRNAAALRALQKCLRENPKLIFQSVEAQLATDFSSQVTLPGEPLQPGMTARGWLTSRSRLQQYQSHIRWSWQVAGIWDCLMMNRVEEARARCSLLLGAADQASIDGGSWLLGNIALLEPAPPYHLFANRGQITNQDLQHTALFDPRWIEVFLGHVKEVDSYQEAKKKLGKAGSSSSNQQNKDEDQKKPNPRGKPKAKPKAGNGSSRRAILESLLRHLLKSRSKLGLFARSLADLRFPSEHIGGTGLSKKCLPLPLPYPEVFRKGTRMQPAESSRKKGVCAIVIVLNYLHLGRPQHVDQCLRAGTPLNAEQWAAVRRLEHLLEAWITVSPIDAAAMGRTAAKVESLEESLKQLETAARELASHHSGYNRSNVADKDHVAVGQFGDPRGKLGLDKMTTFKPVDPSRLQFVGTPSFDPSPYLDPKTRAVFNDPLDCRLSPAEFQGKVPHVRVHCARGQKKKLFELLDASGRLGVHAGSEVTPNFGSGLFCVTKDLNRDRLILDSRAANTLEIPILRWVRSLGSADILLKYVLEPHFNIKISGNDLKDFYYFFRATPSRSRRNVLVGEIPTSEIAHLHCVKEEHLKHKYLYGSLNTLAMGDSQAVEVAQTCHMGLAIQSGIINKENLLSMHLPIPRTPTMSGVVIDDFVSLSRLDSREVGCGSAGAAVTEKMQNKYLDVKLKPNVDKGFRDEDKASFWGADLDGLAGVLRGSLKRAIPLAGLILRGISIGYVTTEFLQIIGGSLISLFLYRRRFLPLLDSLFGACNNSYNNNNNDGNLVVELRGQLLSDLLMMVVLLPLAACNLRAQVSNRIVASDASNWGEAGCVASVPSAVARELYRHVLRRSVWTKLLQPHSAWLRGSGLLDPSNELPDPEDSFSSHPLWQLLAESLHYKLLFSRAKRGNRHINIGELRGFLKSESLEAKRNPSSRGIFGLDSQVILGSVLKGRSSSTAINRELEQSIPTLLCYDWYSEGIYFETASNPADDPTRSREIRKPTRNLPDWWTDLQNDEFSTFDSWMLEHGLDPYELSGLPPIEELQGHDISYTKNVPPVPSAAASQVKPSEPVRSEKNVETGHLLAAVPQEEVFPGEVNTVLEPLDAKSQELLGTFPKSQVVFSKGKKHIWPPTHQGYLDLFSGERGVAKQLALLTGCWVLCFDTAHREAEDLMQTDLQGVLEQLVSMAVFLGVGMAPVCASFSSAITPAVRTREHPYGIPGLRSSMAEKVCIGNAMALWCFKLLTLAMDKGLGVWLENPSLSWMFRLPEWYSILQQYPGLQYWVVDYCRFGTKWRKRTRFATNTGIGGVKTLCTRDHQHLLLRGRSRLHRKSWTAVAQAYPTGVAKSMATSLGIFTKMIKWQGSFDPASCARCGHRRIGEAGHPGPAPRERANLLEDVGLVEERTFLLQQQVWRNFSNWGLRQLSRGAWESALLFPMLLSVLLKEYGNHLYASGQALYIYRHLAVYVQQNILGIRPYMGVVWDMVTRWEIAEPTEHRAPLPEPIFLAMMSLALQWKWFRFAGVLGIAFYGICRPGEAILAERRSLVLPSDMMHDEPTVGYLRIEKPKARRRGKGTVQHASFHDRTFLVFLEALFGNLDGSQRLFPASAHTFRRRWDRLLGALQIDSSIRLTPGGLRGGGAIAAFQHGLDVSTLMWRMRLRNQTTLESYLQEVVANTIMSDLSSESRATVKAAASLAPFYLADAAARASPLLST